MSHKWEKLNTKLVTIIQLQNSTDLKSNIVFLILLL